MILQSSVTDSLSGARTSPEVPLEGIVQKEIQMLAGELRRRNGNSEEELDFSLPIGWEERTGHLDDEPIKRLIIFLRSTGCEWVDKTGGCTMCGFYCATSHGREVSADDYIRQFEHITDTVDLGEYPVISVYNDGNMFNEHEMPLEAIKGICSRIDEYPGIKKVVVESRIDYSPEDRVLAMKKLLNGRQLELAFGFESANPQVMNLCINKGFTSHNFDTFFERMQRLGVLTKPLLLVKPPFLTESESIADILQTLDYLASRGVDYVDLEVTTVEKNTVVHALWEHGLYRPPWLWSLVDLLQRAENRFGDTMRVYVSPWTYSVESLDWAHNCGECDQELVRAVEEYNHRFDTGVFTDIDCSCIDTGWGEATSEQDSRSIPERIRDQLALLRSAQEMRR